MILTPDNEYSAVLDACILVPMSLCDTLLRLAEDPALYRPLWTEQILQEVGAALRKLGYRQAQAEHRISEMCRVFPEAMVNVPAGLVIGGLPDPKDDHVLAAAVVAHTNVIVTCNTRDFPQSCLDMYGILCQTPDDFLVDQYHLNPDTVRMRLDDQATALREERPVVVSRLQRLVPKFAALVRE